MLGSIQIMNYFSCMFLYTY